MYLQKVPTISTRERTVTNMKTEILTMKTAIKMTTENDNDSNNDNDKANHDRDGNYSRIWTAVTKIIMLTIMMTTTRRVATKMETYILTTKTSNYDDNTDNDEDDDDVDDVQKVLTILTTKRTWKYKTKHTKGSHKILFSC